jgi:hypothetical protein
MSKLKKKEEAPIPNAFGHTQRRARLFVRAVFFFFQSNALSRVLLKRLHAFAHSIAQSIPMLSPM